MDEVPEPVAPDESPEGGRRTARLDDAALLATVREGSMAAYGLLYAEFRPLALRRARRLLGRHQDEAEDVVEMAFAAILDAIRNGAGPEDNFARYLMVTVRHTVWRTVRRREREPSIAGDDLLDPALDPQEQPLAVAPVPPDTEPGGGEASVLGAVAAVSASGLDPTLLLSTAFTSLTERHRAVLWLAEVEGREPAEIAVLLGMSPNATAALCYRARKALRSNYFSTYAAEARPECVPLVPRLASYVDDPAKEGFLDVTEHTEWCASCRDVVRGVAESKTMLAVMAPFGVLSLGEWLRPDSTSAADPSALGTGPASHGATGGAAGGAALRNGGRGRRAVAAAAAVLVLAGAIAVLTWGGSDRPTESAAESSTTSAGPGASTSAVRNEGRDDTTSSPTATAPTGPAGSTPTTPVPAVPPTPAVSTVTSPPVDGGPQPTVPPSLPATTVPSGGTGPSAAAIDGVLRADRDGDGPLALRPVGGVPVLIRPAGGVAVQRTASRADGTFAAEGLEPGRYTVLAMVPVGLLPRQSDETPAASGSTQTVEIGTAEVGAGERDSFEVELAPWRSLSATSLGADRTAAAPGDQVLWRFGLSATPATATGVDVTFSIPLPPGASLTGGDVTIEGPAADRTRTGGTPEKREEPVRCEDRSTSTQLVLVCRLDRVTRTTSTLAISVDIDSGSSGRLRPAVAVGPGTGFVDADRVTGSSIALG